MLVTAHRPVPTLVLHLLGLLSGSCDRGPDPGAEALFSRAAELAASGREIEAARALGAQVETLPGAERGAVRLEMARLYHRGGVYNAALENARQALAEGSAGPEALYLEGDSLRELERLGEAERALLGLLEAYPGCHRARLSLARIRARSPDPAGALPLFEAYFRAQEAGKEVRGREKGSVEEMARALLEHGRALRAAGRHQEAADRFAELLERDPLETTLYSELASSLYRLRLRAEARFVEEIYRLISQGAFEEHVEEGLERTGASAFAHTQRASNLIRERRFLRAFESYRRAVEIDPAHPLIRIYHAEHCLRFRRHAEARGILTEGLRRGPRPASGLWWTLSRVLIEGADPRGALGAARKAAETLAAEGDLGGVERGQAHPFSVRLVEARSALETGDLPAAEAAAEEAERALPSAWEPSYWLGRIGMARGSHARALERFNEGASRGGGSYLDLVHWRALAMEKSGRREDALGELRRIAGSSPGYLPAHEALLDLLPGGPARTPVEEAAARLRGLRGGIGALEKSLQGLPLEGSGEAYLKLGKLHRELRDPASFDFLFLASDLLPGNAEALRLLLSGLKGPQDVFVRIHLLRRLLSLEPDHPGVLGELAERYLKLHVRLDEASTLAERLQEVAPSAASHRLRAETALKMGRQAEARAIVEEGLRAFPADPALREALSSPQIR